MADAFVVVGAGIMAVYLIIEIIKEEKAERHKKNAAAAENKDGE